MLLLVDNYDSFTYNLFQSLSKYYLGEVVVRRNDVVTLEEAREATHIVISPGPGHPRNTSDFGKCSEILQKISTSVPTLGVCLGHQGIGLLFGAKVEHAKKIMHGKTSKILHNSQGIFKGVPQKVSVAMYHSFSVVGNSPQLEVTARTEDGEIMGIRHRKYEIHGVQFHPESILTEYGETILQNFIETTSG